MMDTILVPLDGSPLAEATLPLATLLAQRDGAAIQLLQVLPRDATSEERDQAQRYLTALSHDRPRSEVHLRLGDPADQILMLAEALPHPIIAMTTHGRSGLGRWLFGSVADRVVHGSPGPVLVVRPGQPVPEQVDRILVPLDGSALAEAALPVAVELARLLGARLVLVRVVEVMPLAAVYGAAVLGELVDQIHDQAVAYLQHVVERLAALNVPVEVATSEGDHATERLLEHEHQSGIGLVVMATRGRRGMSRVIFGSVAEELLKLGSKPIVVVPVAGVIEEPT